MNLESVTLKYILNKSIYKDNIEYIDKEYIKNNYKELFNIYNVLEEYFNTHENDLSLDELELHFFNTYPSIKDRSVYEELFKSIKDTEVSDDTLAEVLQGIRSRALATRLSDASYNVSVGKGSREELEAAIEAYRGIGEGATGLDEVPEEWFVTDDIGEICNDVYTKHGYRWRLRALNESLGSLRAGNFGFLFARPETGKTTFLASELSFMASQNPYDSLEADRPILWFNNEESDKVVKARVIQAALGWDKCQLMSNQEGAAIGYNHATKMRIKLITGEYSMTTTSVERIIKRMNPGLVVFDQIDKITGFKNDREDLRLGSLYQWARELAKTHGCPVIGVCQADGSGENVKWLTMSNVSSSKTAKQAEADWILGIGKIDTEGMENLRFLNISKNKLTGDSDTIPSLRHGKLTVIIEPEIARYRDV